MSGGQCITGSTRGSLRGYNNVRVAASQEHPPAHSSLVPSANECPTTRHSAHALLLSHFVLLTPPRSFGGAAPGKPPSQYGQNYAQGPYNGHYSTSPQIGSYGAQYSAAAAPPHAHSSGLRQQSYYQSGNYLAPGPAHDGRTSFDSASPIVYSSNPQGEPFEVGTPTRLLNSWRQTGATALFNQGAQATRPVLRVLTRAGVTAPSCRKDRLPLFQGPASFEAQFIPNSRYPRTTFVSAATEDE